MLGAKFKPIAFAVAGLCSLSTNVSAQEMITTEKVEVISSTPLPGIGQSIDKMSSNVQTAKSQDIENSQSLDLSDYMNRNMAGIYLNENQGNPLQADVNYHGFTASPLLGTPQGLSVYMDGVRMNQPFGDVVSWDLIPKNAISTMQLYSGSNPLFGLNTLGGALSIQTKDGRNSPGGAIQFTAGSFGRKIGEAEFGGVSADNSIDYFVAGTWFDEDGWRDHSPSDNKQLFAKLGWQGEKTDLKLTYAYSDSDLNGNGMAPLNMLKQNYKKAYTWPDNTQNESHFLNLNWSHYFADNVVLTGNTYYRNIKGNTLNGDLGDGFSPRVDSTNAQRLGQSILATVSTPLTDANLIARCTSQATAGNEPGEKCSGMVNRSQNSQENYGIFSQISVQNKIFDRQNTYVVGAGYDRSTIHYTASHEYGSYVSDGSIYGIGKFQDPANGFLSNGEIIDSRVNLKGTTNTWSVYATDTLDLTDKISLTGSGRFNHSEIANKDQITQVAGQTLTGTHSYSRFNPSIGLAFNPTDAINLYGNYTEGSRTPTSVELGCADPESPCKLPNSMASDPYLQQVVSKTWEAGIRSKLTPQVGVAASVFDTTNSNDIMFVGTNSSGSGYFKNFGETERKGFDASFNANFDALSLSGNYTYLDATYESAETVNANANSSGILSCQSDGTATTSHTCIPFTGTAPAKVANASGTLVNTATGTVNYNNNNDYWKTISIKKGDRIPLVPRNILKLFADYRVNDKFSVGVNTFTATSSLLRGNENGQDSRGIIAGYTIVNLTSAYRVHPEWLLFAKVNNVFDREYFTSGQLGMNSLNPNGSLRMNGLAANANYSQSVSEAFVAPGAPIAAWVGVRWEFAGKKPSAAHD